MTSLSRVRITQVSGLVPLLAILLFCVILLGVIVWRDQQTISFMLAGKIQPCIEDPEHCQQ